MQNKHPLPDSMSRNAGHPHHYKAATLISVSVIAVVVITLLSVAGCSSAPTYGDLAQNGQNEYVTSCSSCHAVDGQGVDGPPVWGSNAQLAKYGTAQDLLTYIESTMPQSQPKSLKHQTYLDILSYLLIQNNYVSSGTKFNESQLGNVTLQ